MTLKKILCLVVCWQLTDVCKAPAACDFNKNFCTWSNTQSGDDFDWSRHSGSTNSENTGPTYGHTNMNSNDTYIYIETSPRKANDKAILKSERFLNPDGSTCFMFWYHMYGISIGSLTVTLDIQGLQKFRIWSLSGNQGNSWKKGQILLPVLPSEQFYILIEAVRGDDFTGDIAVDDFVAQDEVVPCVKYPSTATTYPEWFAEVRLVNGSNSREGRVEINYRGQWGTVCDDNWDQLEANVVCRQLGYDMSTTKAIAKQEAFFGQGSGNIWLDDMSCNGTEPLLGRCKHPNFGIHNCNHYEDAGVICEELKEDNIVITLTPLTINPVLEGENMVPVMCSANCATYCPVVWYKESVEDANIVSISYTLHLKNVSRSQGGHYTCKIRNKIKTIQLSVIYDNVKLNPPSTYREVIEGDDLHVITCSADCYPPCNINWFKESVVDNNLISTNNGVLNLTNINRTQAGIYTCTVNNIDNNDKQHSQQINITVNYLDPVNILIGKQTIDEYDTLNITCFTESIPRSSITWLNGNDVIQTNSTTNKASLVKENAECFDTGQYSCKCLNSKISGREYTKTTPIYVNCFPRLDTRVPSTTKVIGSMNEKISLEVQVISYPKPLFQWYYLTNNETTLIVNNAVFNEKTLDLDSMIFKSLLELNLNDVTLYKDYNLKIQYAGIWVDMITTSLISQSPPFNITGFKVTNVTEDTICVEWKPGFNGGAVQEFIVEYSTDNSTWDNSSLDIQVQFCMKDLESDTIYHIRMLSRNKFGSTDYIYIDYESGPLKTLQKSTEENSWLIKGVGIGVCAFIVITVTISVSIIIILKHRQKREIMNNPEPYYATFNRGAVNVDEHPYEDVQMSSQSNLNQKENPNTCNADSQMDDLYVNSEQIKISYGHQDVSDSPVREISNERHGSLGSEIIYSNVGHEQQNEDLYVNSALFK